MLPACSPLNVQRSNVPTFFRIHEAARSTGLTEKLVYRSDSSDLMESCQAQTPGTEDPCRVGWGPDFSDFNHPSGFTVSSSMLGSGSTESICFLSFASASSVCLARIKTTTFPRGSMRKRFGLSGLV